MNRNVRSLLVKNGIKHKEIAASLGLSRSYVSGVISGHWKGEAVRRYIAALLKKDYHKLWDKAGKAA